MVLMHKFVTLLPEKKPQAYADVEEKLRKVQVPPYQEPISVRIFPGSNTKFVERHRVSLKTNRVLFYHGKYPINLLQRRYVD